MFRSRSPQPRLFTIMTIATVMAALAACDDPPQANKAKTPVPQAQAEGPQTGPDADATPVAEDRKPTRTAQRSPVTSLPAGPMSRPHTGGDPHAALTPGQLIKVALQHQAEGREVEAMASLTSAIMRFPDSADLRAVRASVFLQQGKVTEALQDLEKAVALAPDNPEIRVNRAEAYRRFNRIDEALADLDKAVAVAPDMVAARFNRGSLYFAKGEYEKAVTDFDHAVAVNPHAAAPWFNLAIAKQSLGNQPGAEADMKRFLELTDNEQWRKTAKETLDAWQRQAKDDTQGKKDAGQ